MTLQNIITEGMKIHNLGRGSERKEHAATLLERVGLSRDHLKSYPHEFRGGQRQRIAVARAPSVEPKLIVADDPVSALDVSIQAQIINLLLDLKDEFVSDRVVMYLGKIMETAPANELYRNPVHPYTESLLAAVVCMTSTWNGKTGSL